MAGRLTRLSDRGRRGAIALGALVAFGMAGTVPAAAGGCPGQHARPNVGNLGLVTQATLCLLNKRRHHAHAHALVEDPRLDRAAAEHSQDMLAHAYFAHNSLNGVSPFDRIEDAGYKGKTLGENIAWGKRSRSTPAAIMRAWMHSAGHRENILNRRYRNVGIGIAAPGHGSIAIYTTEFGGR